MCLKCRNCQGIRPHPPTWLIDSAVDRCREDSKQFLSRRSRGQVDKSRKVMRVSVLRRSAAGQYPAFVSLPPFGRRTTD